MNTETTPKPDKKAKPRKWKTVVYSGIALGIITVGVVVALMYFPDMYLNKYIKDKITTEFPKAYPGYSIAISDLRIYLLADNIELKSAVISSHDSTFSCSADNPSVKGIGWLELIRAGASSLGALDGSVATVQNIVVNVRKQSYRIRCKNLKVSLRHSMIIADSLKISPSVDDNTFFAESKFRKTRYRIIAPHITIGGETMLGLLRGKICCADFINAPNLSLDMLVNTDKPIEPDSVKKHDSPSAFAAFRKKVRADSIGLENLRITYSESNFSDSLPPEGYSIHSTGFHASIQDSSVVCKTLAISPLHQTDGYGFRCGAFRASMRDSNLTANDVAILPVLNVDDFFDNDKFRRTRLSVELQKIAVSGLSFQGLMSKEKYAARRVEVREPSFGIQVSVFRPVKKPMPKSLMPNEMIAAVKEFIRIDTIAMQDGRIMYEEYVKARSKPAYISFDNVDILARDITNYKKNGDTAGLHFSGRILDGGILTMDMQLPLTSPQFSPKFTGSLTTMNLNKLNAFLEIAERVRIKEGVCQSAKVTVQVNNGKATGNVRILYKDFNLAFLDEAAKSEKGIFNIVKSFLANTFAFNSSNEADEDGVVKLGMINYTRKQDDSFLQFTWFSVRHGIGDLIGFPEN